MIRPNPRFEMICPQNITLERLSCLCPDCSTMKRLIMVWNYHGINRGRGTRLDVTVGLWIISWGIRASRCLMQEIPTSRKGREKWGTHIFFLGMRFPP